jgi:hypothetical protein
MKYTLGILPLTVEQFFQWRDTHEGARDGLFLKR